MRGRANWIQRKNDWQVRGPHIFHRRPLGLSYLAYGFLSFLNCVPKLCATNIVFVRDECIRCSTILDKIVIKFFIWWIVIGYIFLIHAQKH